MATTKIAIDGERKGVLRRINPGEFRYDGLLLRSEWEGLKAEPGMVLVTMRALEGITLHVQECDGQFPVIGTVIPSKLLKGRSGITRSGRQMAAHLTGIETLTRETRSYARLLQGAKKVIL